MFWLELSLCYLAWCLLCLGLPRHHRQVFGREPTARVAAWLRGGGWLVLATSFAVCIAVRGWEFGPVYWGAMLVLSALVWVLLLPYAARWAPRLAGVAPVLAMLLPV